jgi:predicted enzyme related to lactoylglutathione lyase
MTGAPSHFELGVPDARRAKTFYGGLLGWSFRTTRGENAWIDTDGVRGGLHGEDEAANVVVYFRVPDIEAAVRRVRELGGRSEDAGPAGEGGRFAACRDDQGVQFGLHEPDGDDALVNVRYLVDDVEAAVAFYTGHLGFTLLTSYAPAFADVLRGNLRLLLSGPTSSAGRAMPDGTRPAPGGWNRIHLLVDDLEAEVDRLRATGLRFRSEIVKGPGGSQIVLDDPSGNPVELFQPSQSWPPPAARAT